MNGEQSAALQQAEKIKYINRSLNKFVQALVGEDDARRERAIRILSTAHPAITQQLAEKLVRKLERGDDQVRQRAQAALMAAGKYAITTVALAAVQSQNSTLHFAAIDILLAIGLKLHESERVAIIATLIDMFRAKREKPVRDAAMNALWSLRETTNKSPASDEI